MTIHLPVLTNSSATTWRRCKKEYLLSYVLGYRPRVKEEALRIGTLIHLGLEAWWSAHEHRLEAALVAMQPHTIDEYDWVRASVLLQGYDVRWRDANLEVLGIEAEFRAPLVNPDTGAASRTFQLGGKMDVIIRDLDDGLVYKTEHKTSGEDITPGSTYWLKLKMNPQISTYYVGARAMGYDVAGCLYDVIGKPKIIPLKATPEESRKYNKKDGKLNGNQREFDETPEEFRERFVSVIAENPDRYYVRGTVVRLENEERDAAFDMWSVAREIREAELAQRYPRNPDGCERYHRLCPYWAVCTGEASLDDESRFLKVEHVHQELTAEQAG
jgi:hypothetical protein